MHSINDFSVGYVVRLYGSECLMTVKNVNTNEDIVTCQWFDTDDHLHEAEFITSVLTIVRR